MQLRPDANISRFLLAVQNCIGDVCFITPEGDNLNLKSTLSQFVFAAVIAGHLDQLHGKIQLKNAQDFTLLQGYLQ